MGFGILLMGFLLSMSNYPGYTDCISFFVVFYALLKLGVYNKFLRMAKYISFAIMVGGIAGMMLSLGEFIGFVNSANVYIDVYDNLSEAVKVIFGLV